MSIENLIPLKWLQVNLFNLCQKMKQASLYYLGMQTNLPSPPEEDPIPN